MKKSPRSEWGRDVLAKGRKPGESLADALRRRLERAIAEFEEINLHLKRGQMAVESLTPDLLNVLLDTKRREKISDATKDGIKRAKARRVKFGGARKRKPKLSTQQVRRLHELRRKGFTQEQIAEALGVSQAHISKLLQRRKK